MSGLDQDAVQTRPPPAPPLPQHQRYSHRAATAIARLTHPFFASSRPNAQRGSPDLKVTRDWDGEDQHTLPSVRKEAVHKTGLPISAVDISPDRGYAVLAGREILRTIRVDESSCAADFDLRSGIISYASTHATNRDGTTIGQKEQLAAVDVKWSHGNYDRTIATAASNGRIIIYDLHRPSIEIATCYEHNRQVHRIDFNPHQPALLLSGSQDGTVRLWDLRSLGGQGGRSVQTFSSFKRYSANSEGIRDVKWAHHDGLIFAIGTENGSIQKWDLHKEKAPLLRLHGHDSSCSAIDWHPDGRYLASASSEKLVKIWDFGSEDRRMKPLNTIRTPQAVNHMRWRPNIASSSGHAFDQSYMTTQISTSYDAKDPRIHIWDLQRPNVPILEIEKYDTPATGLVWHSRNLLWSVGQTGTFTQNDLNSAFEPAKRHGAALAIGSDGKIAFFSSRRARFGLISESIANGVGQTSLDNGPSPDHVVTLSDISPEEPISENTIQRRRQKTLELRSNSGFGPNAAEEKIERLQNLKAQLIANYTSPQLTAVGYVPYVCDSDSVAHMATRYKLPSYEFLTGRVGEPHLYVRNAFEKFAQFAYDLGELRLAQTWRILACLVDNELERRLEHNKGVTLENSVSLTEGFKRDHEHPPSVKTTTISKANDAPNLGGLLSTISIVKPKHDGSMLETLSQGQPSLAKASDTNGSSCSDLGGPHKTSNGKISEKEVSVNGISKPHRGAALANKVADPPVTMPALPEIQVPFTGFAGLEEHLEESRSALNSYRARPRAILNLDPPYVTPQDASYMASLARHDSNESFQMFSASADSDPRSFSLEDSFDERKSFSQISNGSFTSLQPGFAKTKLDDLKEDDGQSTPLVLEPQELAEDQQLPVIEKVSSQISNHLVKEEPIVRPLSSEMARVHRDETSGFVQNRQTSSSILFAHYTSNAGKPTDPRPWSIYSILRPIINHHVKLLFDSQFPTIVAIWLWQFFPTEFDRAQITNLVLFYHKRLLSLELYEPAARLRECCATLFPEILEYTSGTTAAILFCRNCNQAFDKKLRSSLAATAEQSLCTHCRTTPASCAICETISPPKLNSSQPGISSAPGLWSWCQGCGHGGHASCLKSWFSAAGAVAEGACAIPGCNHDCVPGIRREQVVADLERQRKRQRKSVIRDDWSVGESKAVEHARDIVAPAEQPPVATTTTTAAGALAARRGGKTNALSNARRVRLLGVDDQNGAALAREE